ncbi:hypothetical protein ACHAWU_003432 [Discostella pseudostelligera]|uniref:Uncharacterized protein n=1 Tax=Discostella pseudostelligera TaxID=259834 RepID=A0ABD3MV09_9STRA
MFLVLYILTYPLLVSAFSVSNYSLGSKGRRSTLAQPPHRWTVGHVHKCHDDYEELKPVPLCQQQQSETTRRELLENTAASLFLGISHLGCFAPQPSQAADDASGGSVNNKRSDEEGMVSQIKLATLLKRIPTFAIVDTHGVPYFVVGEDAKLTSYFFLSYGEAKRILDVAISSSDKAIERTKREMKAKNGVITKEDEDEIGINPWKNARITSVPLDLAVSLASKGKLAGAYFRLAPSELDIENALTIDGSDDLPEGRVPLFYVEDMTITDMGEVKSPLYFQQDQAIAEYRNQMKRDKSIGKNASSDPNIKVTELFATITEMLRPGGTDEELKRVCFIPPSDSIAKAEKCRKSEKEPFRLGERLIVL